MEAIQSESSKLSSESTGKLESVKHDAGGTFVAKPHAEDHWMKTEYENLSQLKKRADNYLQKLKALTGMVDECARKHNSWTSGMKQLAAQEEKALDACRDVHTKLEDEKKLIEAKQTEHSTWKTKNEAKLEGLKTKVSSSVSTCGRISTKAKGIIKSTSNESLQGCMKKGEGILKSIEEGLKSLEGKSKADAEDLVDDIRMEYVNFVSTADTEVEQGNYKLKESTGQFESLQKELAEKETISKILKELHAVPQDSYWDDQLDSLKKQANSCLELLEEINTEDIQNSLDKMSANIKELSPLVDKVKERYKNFKSEIEA
uniref:Uncharacterized protein n=1 Tax=Lotharella oceanica TaxID=641309 RepID=A0A7S2TGA6_9EUKA